MDDDDSNIQLAAYHPGNSQQAFPTPIPPPTPQGTNVPAQKLRDAVGGLFFQKPSPPPPKR